MRFPTTRLLVKVGLGVGCGLMIAADWACSGDDQGSSTDAGRGGAVTGRGPTSGSGAGSGETSGSGNGARSGSSGSGTATGSSGGNFPHDGGASGSASSGHAGASGASGSSAKSGASGAGASGTGGTGSSGSSDSSGRASSGAASSGGSGSASGTPTSGDAGTPKMTADLIGTGGASCGNTHATHADGWLCILNYPSAGDNEVGAWFDYPWAGGTCTHALKKPSKTNWQVCYSGGSCSGANPGAGLAFSVCDIHGVDVSTWPQMKSLITAHSLSTTGKSSFTDCNGGTLTDVHWTTGTGSTPAGMSVQFQDADDLALGQVDGLAEGADSVAVPATIDATKIASVHFVFDGSKVSTWNFCLSKVTLGYR